MNIEAGKHYDKAFFNRQVEGSLQSASLVIPELINQLHPKSVVDVGCGVGGWLQAFKLNGVVKVKGIDGDYVDRSQLLISKNEFKSANLSQPHKIIFKEKFDLALSLEVAEHLPESVAKDFVVLLTRLSPVIIFSAAIPFQGGTSHVNEQWQSYWVELFEGQGYQVIDWLRPKIWDTEAEWWYAQNMLTFVQKKSLKKDRSLEKLKRDNPFLGNLVHPKNYLQKQRSLAERLRDLLKQGYRSP